MTGQNLTQWLCPTENVLCLNSLQLETFVEVLFLKKGEKWTVFVELKFRLIVHNFVQYWWQLGVIARRYWIWRLVLHVVLASSGTRWEQLRPWCKASIPRDTRWWWCAKAGNCVLCCVKFMLSLWSLFWSFPCCVSSSGVSFRVLHSFQATHQRQESGSSFQFVLSVTEVTCTHVSTLGTLAW